MRWRAEEDEEREELSTSRRGSTRESLYVTIIRNAFWEIRQRAEFAHVGTREGEYEPDVDEEPDYGGHDRDDQRAFGEVFELEEVTG
jgi:hypothetical protein